MDKPNPTQPGLFSDCLGGVMKTIYIARKELLTYFVSPIAYIIAFAYLFISGYFFTMYLVNSSRADLDGFLHNTAVVLLLMVPVLTMRLIAEERKQRTMELLVTSPLSSTQIVLGKYLACVTLVMLMVSCTLAYPYLITKYGGKPDWGPIQSGYIGLFGLVSSFVAVGLFTSSLTENQLVAAVASFGILLLLWIVSWLSVYLEEGWMSKFAEAASIFMPYRDFIRGSVESRYYLYYGSVSFIFVFASIRMLEASRWR